MVNYDDLVNSLSSNPRDIVTVPMNNRKGKWFYAFAENGTVFVTVSKEHEPKCSIKMPRPLKKEECGELYELYLRRKKGEHISGLSGVDMEKPIVKEEDFDPKSLDEITN